MKNLLNYKYIGSSLIVALSLIFIFSSDLVAQEQIHPLNAQMAKPYQYGPYAGNLKTAATATCPTSPVSLSGQDTLGASITSGHTFVCNATPFYIYVPGVSGNIASPCIETEYTNYHTNMGNNGTETFYEGGVNIGCIGPSSGCSFPIGSGALNNTQWGLILSLLDPSQQHDFSFCRSGNITAGTISFIDCWTGAQLASTPTSTVFSTANPPSTSTCFTMTVPANTAIGTASYTILPVTAAPALTDLHDGEAYVNTALLGVGSYTVNYSFTPPASSGCGTVTGTFKFNIGPNITATVNSPSVCAGTTATLTASSTGGTGTTTFSWTPSTGLSATTGSMVTVTNPTLTSTYTVTAMNGGCTASATSTITINPTPTVTVNSPSVCAGNTATLTASGATTYSWSAGLSATTGSVVTASPASTTIYTVTGTSLTCTSSVTSTITVVNGGTITATSASVCPGGTGTLTASGSGNYIWTPTTGLNPTTGSTVLANPASTTVYTITGSNGACAAIPGTATLTISVFGSLIVSNDTTLCLGGSAVLTASGATTYSWNPTTGLSPTTGSMVTATPTITTSYTVTGTMGGCTSQGFINISINPTPTVTAISNPAAICAAQQTATLTASGASTYTWNPSTDLSSNTGTSVITNTLSASTNYTITGTDANGCVSAGTVSLTVYTPAVINSSPVSVCIGSIATLTVSGASTYTWTPATNLSSPNGTTVTTTPTSTAASTYTIISTDANGCISATVTTLSVNDLPMVTAVSATTCAGSSTSLSANGAITYTWTPVTGLSSPTGSMVTTTPTTTSFYTVTGTDGNGCMGVNTATVTANPLPNVNAGLDQTICKGSSVQLGANGADTYVWTPAASLSNNTISNPTATPSVTTNYTVVGTNTLTNCQASDVVLVATSSVNPVILADPQTGDAPLTIDFTNGTTGATTYTWNYGNGSTQVTSTAANTQTIYQSAGTYTVTLTAADAAGCSEPTSTIIIVTEGFAISIPNIFTPNGDGLNDNFFVKSSGVSTMNIIIFDRWGLKMWESNSAAGMWDGKSGSADAKDGTYFYIIKVTDTKNVSTDYKGNITLIR